MLKGFDETADHFFLMMDLRFGFIVPKRELAPATALALRRTMQDFRAAKQAAESRMPQARVYD